MRLNGTTPLRGDRTQWAIIAAGVVVVVIVVGLTSYSVVFLGLMVVLAAAVFAVVRVGFLTAVCAAAIFALGFSAFLERIAPQAAILTQAGVLALIGVGVITLPKVWRSSRLARVTVPYLIVCTFFAGLMAFEVPELAFRGWISLTAPVWTIIAITGSLGRVADGRGVRRRAWVVYSVLAVAVANALVGARQAIVGMNGSEIRDAMSNDSTYLVGTQIRLMGTFASNQDFGAFTACIAPALLILAVRGLGVQRGLYAAACIATYAVIFLSLTRTALIASVVVGVIALAIWGEGNAFKRIIKGAFAIGVTLGVGVFVASQLDIPRINDGIRRARSLLDLDNDVSFNARLGDTLPRAVDAFAQNPLGSGLGAAGSNSIAFSGVTPFGILIADNGYLMIGIQIGVLGLAAFVFMAAKLVVALGRDANQYSAAAAAAVLGILVSMLTADYWNLVAAVCAVMALVGVGLASHQAPASDAPSVRRAVKLSV